MSKMHELKSTPDEYEGFISRRKTYDVRPNDRGFLVHDILHLKEWSPLTQGYTGRETYARIIHMTPGGTCGLPMNLCVLGLELRISTTGMTRTRSSRPPKPPAPASLVPPVSRPSKPPKG